MAPNSRIILTRHAQAEHNVDLDYSIPDAPLTALGKKQAASLALQVKHVVPEVELVATSPLKRTLQTTKLGWRDAIERLGIQNIATVPQFQECNDFPCDTGSSKEDLEANPEFAGFDFSNLTPDWTSKKGFWAPDSDAIANRARWVRQWLRNRPEKTIVLVGHGDILRELTADASGPSGHMWRNAEAQIFTFDPDSVGTDDCFLWQEKGEDVVAVAGGYAPGSTEADILTNGKL